MPTVAEQLVAARLQVKLYAQTNVEPTLEDSEAELDAILAQALRASTWAVATAYTYGARVMPTVRNGHSYICTQAGTSETLLADEPDWPTSQAATITEGDSDPILTWREDGPDFDNVYDIRFAIHLAWLAKAAKASANYQIRMGGYNDHAEQMIYVHCLEMAERYALLGMA